MTDWQKAFVRGAVVAIGLMAFGTLAYDFIRWEQISLAIAAGVIVALAYKDDLSRR